MAYFRIYVSLGRRNKKNKNALKEGENDKLAQKAMLVGAAVTLIGLIFIPLVWPVASRPSWWLTYDANTGVVGDTIGGIAGPILNFTGLLVVYYSLREQILTNKTQFNQFQEENTRDRNSREFELTFRLVEKLVGEAVRHATSFEKIGEKDWVTNWNGKIGTTTAEANTDEEVYDKYARILNGLFNSFLMIVIRLESTQITLDQQSVLQRILSMQYEPYLREGIKGYDTYFTDQTNKPHMMNAINQQLDVLEKQRNRIDVMLAAEATTSKK